MSPFRVLLPTLLVLGVCSCKMSTPEGTIMTSPAMTVTDLRCEYQPAPMGLDERAPRLAWKLQSDQRGQRQTAYRVLVSSRLENLASDNGDLWDSGKIPSDLSTRVLYEGKPLQSRMDCFWKVRVWDKDGNLTGWSQPARWSMGLLDSSDWKAKWIGLQDIHVDPHLYHGGDEGTRLVTESSWVWHPEASGVDAPAEPRYFRQSFELPANRKVRSATFTLTCDNAFDLWVNGQHAGNGSIFTVVYKIDIRPFLKPGENVVAIKGINHGDTANPAGLIGAAVIAFADGEPMTIKIDENWRVSKTEESGWMEPGHDFPAWERPKSLGPYGMQPWGEIISERRRLPAIHLRKEFSAQKPVKRARVYVSGLGYYIMFLNGERVGDHELDPILRDYSKQVPYVTYDVTDAVQRGENAIGVVLGCGRFYAPHTEAPVKTRDFGYPRLLLQMELDYADGTRELVASDNTWRATDNGPIGNNNDYDGEYYDARMEMPGWTETGFDAGRWRATDRMDPPAGPMTSAACMQPMRVTTTLKPVNITEPEPGVWVFDFGQNFVGRCRLTVQGPAGTEVRMHFAENIKRDGMLDFRNLRLAECTDTYILKGEGAEIYTPSFTYHGFRYVEMQGFSGKPDPDTLVGEVIHTDMEFTGDFQCSNPVINQILKNARWGMRGNYLSIPTDCPQRDERHGWLGDRAAEQLGEAYLFDNRLLYEKWMGDIRDAQKDTGAVPDVAPNYWSLYSDNVTWPAAFVIIPGNLYRQYGDIRAIEENYDSIKRWVAHLRQYLEDGLMPRDQYGDWCVPPEDKTFIHTREPQRKTPKELLGTTYYYQNLKLLEQYARILGKDQEAEEFHADAAVIRDAFNRRLYDEDRGFYGNGSQTSQILPLVFGMVPNERRKSVFAYLANHIETKTDWHIGTGLIGGQWLMRTLSDNGRIDIAYRFATHTDYPSWGYMIENGATTIWELWNGNTADPAMNSGNHVMLLGDVVIWMFEYLGGIKSDIESPGFKHILMSPQIVGDLTSARAKLDSPYGPIESDWKLDGDRFDWRIAIPPNTTATISIPAADRASIKESNQPAESAEGVSFLREENGGAVYRIQSGRYTFQSTPGE